MKKHGFTLAEVLITLVIIGVIGALTVPALIQNTQKQEYVSALKKAYSVLSQVTNQIIADEGKPFGDGGWVYNNNTVYNLYRRYLNSAKECNAANGCFPPEVYKGLTGGNTYNYSGGYLKKLILADGMIVGFDPNMANGVGRIQVDINGAKKPNTWGRDMFQLYIPDSGLTPVFPGSSCDKTDCNTSVTGYQCACRVLAEGAMNY